MTKAAPRSVGPRFGRLSITAYLSLGIGALMFVAVASVLAITLYANWRNTTELLRDKSRLMPPRCVRLIRSPAAPTFAPCVAAPLRRPAFAPPSGKH